MFGIGGIGVWIGHGLAEPTGESRLAGVAGVGDDTDRLVEVDGDNPMQRGPNRPCLSAHRERVHVGVWTVDLGGFDERDADSDGVGCADLGIDRLAARGAIRFESSTSAGRATGSASTAAATIGPSTGPLPASSTPRYTRRSSSRTGK